ncbi:uncharacterized protein Z518_06572 [Rhinocladiella mackenziei CBS 650.93]|uniref:ABM domain-containing protein n=1 Tax=Rhinocladiella mackenziei CBS 650.93 TaxID=1442369 RepID=A0A0D2FM53_9EURO|nr:uncharacterized protein Z518_06572 [Rhinocladiella mackenziei CBS 650.93]KIX03022.1 hypothetical protein Z518_06572 [Rhinocladiella mackenziei CBS 650.93]
MPLIEIATVRLRPEFSSELPPSFTETWSRALRLAGAAAGIPFQLYQNDRDSDLYYLFGGWATGADHIAFLSTSSAVELAQAIGQYMTVDIVRHIDGDVRDLIGRQQTGDKLGRLKVGVYKVPNTMLDEWKHKWQLVHEGSDGVGGWDMSASVQTQHKAFREMGEAINSVSAFGGNDPGGITSWVWVTLAGAGNEGDQGGMSKNLMEDVETDFFEMEHVLG